ncbi:hypothetical protein Tco_1396420, partial [Tanacetum coccineum]
MADENVPAPAPTRSDDQILPFAAWFPIEKSNYVLDLQKNQKNPIFQISMDILSNTNFFRAFTALASVPTIYIQQFWNTLTYVEKARTYRFQLDENWFTLDANLLREALEITPIDQAHPFVSPPSGDAIMDFVNELGYTEEIYFVSSMAGIITSTNVDYAELLWEEFVQAVQKFLTDKANLGSPTKKGQKDKILCCRFTKLIICHLGRTHNIHQRSTSPVHLAEEYLRLGNLKFVPKGKDDEVFRMPIPKELISNNISNAPYYNAYMEMVAKYDRKIAAENEGKKQPASAKQPKSKSGIEKSSKPVLASKPKPAKEKPSKPSTANPPKPKPAKEKPSTPLQKPGKGKVAKVHNVKSSFQLVDEPDEEPTQSEHKPKPEHQGEGEEYDMERAIQMSLESFQAQGHAHVGGVVIRELVAEAIRPLPVVEGKGKAIRRTPATEEASTGPYAQPHDDTSVNIVRDSPSPTDAETGAESDKTNSGGDIEILHISEEPGEDVDKQVNLEEKTTELDQDQAGSDPGETHESRPRPEQVQESLKFPADKHVILEDTLSSTGTLSSMKNLEDAYTIGDQFINDKSTKDEPGKLNVEAEAVSMQKNKNLNNTTRNLGSRVFNLELRDLPHKIDETVRETVKEAIHVALQAPLRDRFRDLPEADMKEMLHQRMFET